MEPLVGALVIILVALVGARFSFATESVPLGPRLLFRTGTHFLIIGFLIGPSGLGVVTAEATRQLLPFLALGLGWVGFHFGLQLDRDSLRRFRAPYHVFAIGQAVLAFTLFLGVGWMALAIAGFTDRTAHLLLLGAASTAAVTAPAGIAMVSSNFLVKGRVRDLLLFVGSVDAWLGIVALQVGYSFYRADSVARDAGALSELSFFLAVALGLGILCGIVFLWLVRVRPTSEELVLYLLGICAFSAGAALQWGLSPLFVAMVMGAIVANMARDRERISVVLRRWEKPVYVTFLLLAGALLQVPSWWVFPCALAYALLRFVSKTVAAAVMVSLTPFDPGVPRRIGLGLIPQGGISIAMAASGMLVYSDLQFRGLAAEATLLAVVVIGVILSELTGPFLTIRVLRHAGEISPQVERAIADGDSNEARIAAFQPRSG
jgi:hypothetical protein